MTSWGKLNWQRTRNNGFADMCGDRSPVRASDIGAWTFCHRAWWLAHVRGAPHERPESLIQGREAHRRHGLAVIQARRLMVLGLALIGVGLVVLALFLFSWL